MENITLKLCQLLIKANSIEERYESIYLYGIRNLFLRLIFFITMLLIGFLTKMSTYSVIFYLVYSAVRGYYGGYHAKSRRRCFLYSNLLFVGNIAFAIMLYDRMPVIVLWGALIIACMILQYLHFMDHKKHMFLAPATIVFILYVTADCFQANVASKAMFTAVISTLIMYLINRYKIHEPLTSEV